MYVVAEEVLIRMRKYLTHTGEPLTISYVTHPSPRLQRQRELRALYSFDCRCTRCLKEEAMLAEHAHGAADAAIALAGTMLSDI